MGTKILEGLIEELGAGRVLNGNITTYSFIKIGGVRHKNISFDNYLGSFIKIGATVRLSIKTSFFHNYVYALQESDGTISKLTAMVPIYAVGQVFIFTLLVVGFISFWMYMATYTELASNVFFFGTFGTSALVAYGQVKARNALDGKPAPVVAAKA